MYAQGLRTDMEDILGNFTWEDNPVLQKRTQSDRGPFHDESHGCCINVLAGFSVHIGHKAPCCWPERKNV